MCVLSIKVPIRKKSLETYLMILIAIAVHVNNPEKYQTMAKFFLWMIVYAIQNLN